MISCLRKDNGRTMPSQTIIALGRRLMATLSLKISKAKEGLVKQGSEFQKTDQSGIEPSQKDRENFTFKSTS